MLARPRFDVGTGLVAVATHGGAGLVASEPAGAFVVTGLVLDSSVAADQAVIAVAASVRHIRPVAVVPVVGLIGVVPVVVEAVAVVVVPVSIVIVVIAVPVDVVPGDVSVVVVVDGSPTASTTPVHSPCSEAPAAAEATGNEAATPANGGANRYPGAKGQHRLQRRQAVYRPAPPGARHTQLPGCIAERKPRYWWRVR